MNKDFNQFLTDAQKNFSDRSAFFTWLYEYTDTKMQELIEMALNAKSSGNGLLKLVSDQKKLPPVECKRIYEQLWAMNEYIPVFRITHSELLTELKNGVSDEQELRALADYIKSLLAVIMHHIKRLQASNRKMLESLNVPLED